MSDVEGSRHILCARLMARSLELDDRHTFVAWIDVKADARQLPQAAMQRGADAAAASTVNQPERLRVGEQRVVQRALGACERLLDGQPVQIDFGGSGSTRP